MIDLQDPNQLLLLTVDLFTKAKIPYAMYGGLALAVYGIPRETGDVDCVLLASSVEATKQLLTSALQNSIVPIDAMDFGAIVLTRVTVLPGELQKKSYMGLNMVDLIVPKDQAYSQRILARAVTGPFLGREVTVVAPEDFVLLKCLSAREQDLFDVQKVLEVLGDRMDLDLIQNEINNLAVEYPELVERWEKIRI